MKNHIAIFVLFLFGSCSPKITSTPSVSLMERDAQGLVSLTATGYGNNQADREHSAQRIAFETILFKGLPSSATSALRLPMIEKPTEAQSKNKAFFNAFFEKGKMQDFVQSMAVSGGQRKLASKHSMAQEFALKINYDALRKHLESEGVIRKFGY